MILSSYLQKFRDDFKEKNMKIVPNKFDGCRRILGSVETRTSDFAYGVQKFYTLTFNIKKHLVPFEVIDSISIWAVDEYKKQIKENIKWIDRLYKITILRGDTVLAHYDCKRDEDILEKEFNIILPCNSNEIEYTFFMTDLKIELKIEINLDLPLRYMLTHSPWIRDDRWGIVLTGGDIINNNNEKKLKF
uniref:Uncharacterized protein n=1 Tax=Mimivirus LCMiAC02 TaxID=2506609 RepID=A0A481Z232_9VIRU|nr:MAG: hypothetical protein LCMiAC02_05600 [Mimivirus LCMiAC02]